jgi:hypothetical protein
MQMRKTFEFETQRPMDARSVEVQEIIGQIPNRITRYGTIVLFTVMVLVLLISWFVRYPDVLPAPLVITTTPPPVVLVSRTNGKLILVKEDEALVQPGDVVAYVASPADLNSVQQLKAAIKNNEEGGEPLSLLGELQPHYELLMKAQEELSIHEKSGAFTRQIAQLLAQKAILEKLKTALESQEQLAKAELHLAREKFRADSVLHIQKVTAVLDFNQSKGVLLQQIKLQQSANMAVINSELQLNQLSKQISDLQQQQMEHEQRLVRTLNSARHELLSRIEQWEENFLFVAPNAGRLAYLGFHQDQKYIQSGMDLFSVVPEQGTVIARAELPIWGSGKVKEGQEVRIRLENYPFEQFGTLNGRVSKISVVPGKEHYWLTIDLPAQLETSQKIKIEFKQQLTGQTEIITEDLRLLERFFYQFRKLLNVSR